MLVEFETGHTPGFLGIARLERELAELLGAGKVDLRTPEDLSRYFRDQVLATAEVQYAAHPTQATAAHVTRLMIPTSTNP